MKANKITSLFPGNFKVIDSINMVVVTFGVILICFIWLGLFFKIDSERQMAISDATTATANLAHAFKEHTLRTIKSADQTALSLQYSYERNGQTIDMSVYKEGGIFYQPTIVLAGINDENDDFILSNTDPHIFSNLSDREHVSIHHNADSGRLYISKPVLGRSSGRWSINMTRRINKPDGSYGGAAIVAIDPYYFRDFYRQVDLGRDSAIALVGSDGIVRVWQSAWVSDDFGQDLNEKETNLMRQIADQDTGNFTAVSSIDGVKRISSYETIEEYPLTVVVGVGEDEMLAALSRRQSIYYQVSFILSAFVCVACLAIHLLVRRIKDNFRQIQLQSGEIAKREEEYYTLVENAQDVIIRSDRARRCLYVNPVIKAYTGTPAQGYVGKGGTAELPVPFVEQMDKAWGTVFATSQEQSIEFEYLTPKEEKVYFQARIVPEINPAGEVATVLSVIRNVTGNKVMEKQLAHFDRLNLVGEMAAGIAHEIRNPMTTIRGFMQFMGRKTDLPPQHKKYTHIVIEEIDRIDFIIKEFLSLARDKAISLRETNLNGIIEAIAPLIQADALMASKYIHLELGQIATIRGDENELRQLILNFARNGIEAMAPGGRLTIRTYQEHREVVMAIIDQGHGITKETMERLGRPFFTTKECGTGLGLAICYSIATRHDAAISFESSNTGTAVAVRFQV